jgi:hypothetical protein
MDGVSVNGAQEQAGRVCLGSAQLGEGQVGTVPAEGDRVKVEVQQTLDCRHEQKPQKF